MTMRTLLLGFVVIGLGCGPNHGGGTDGNGGDGRGSPDACVGLQCQVVNCTPMSLPPTTISGKVFAPNGTLPLYGISVYVPNSDPGPIATGLQCNHCSDPLPGNPIGTPVKTDETGAFTLTNMPSGANIPLVITTGKWRRILKIANVNQCGDNPILAADTTLPKAHDDLTASTVSVDMPQIAVTTGNADSLECLLRRLGIADKEITNKSGGGRVHLYTGNGVSKFDSGFMNGQGGQSLTSATPFWGGNLPGTPDDLKAYDIVILSCEGSQNAGTKPQVALDALKGYADVGGRVFASHWHNIWIGGGFQNGGPPAGNALWTPIAMWNGGNPGPVDLIDEASNPKGPNFATWMLNVMGSTTRDQIQLVSGTEKSTCSSLDPAKAERWTYIQGSTEPQNFQFTTPIEVSPESRCGKVVFSDMHVSGGSIGTSYPSSCGSTLTLTPQEKALAFMFFDIASCVSNIP